MCGYDLALSSRNALPLSPSRTLGVPQAREIIGGEQVPAARKLADAGFSTASIFGAHSVRWPLTSSHYCAHRLISR